MLNLRFHRRVQWRIFPSWSPQCPKLASNQQAVDVGFDVGSRLRRRGAKPQDLIGNLELYALGHVMEGGRRNVLREWWRRGFEAGFLDRPKPDATN
jgi:hypothetical protein